MSEGHGHGEPEQHHEAPQHHREECEQVPGHRAPGGHQGGGGALQGGEEPDPALGPAVSRLECGGGGGRDVGHRQ